MSIHDRRSYKDQQIEGMRQWVADRKDILDYVILNVHTDSGTPYGWGEKIEA